VDAILKAFTQLHEKGVFEPQYASTLAYAQRHGSLCAVNLIKEKWTAEIKGRTYDNDSVQRLLVGKSETTSATVANDAVLSFLIDAKERCDVATANVVEAYLNAIMDQFNKSYKKSIVQEKGKSVLYLQMKEALYGSLESALLWYELFVNT
jgi:hypothetical protein